MLKNYLITALRGLWRSRRYSLINVFGLSVGLAACLMIFTYVRHELSFDHWIADHERVHIVETTFALSAENTFRTRTAPGPAKAAFIAEIPGIETGARFGRSERKVLKGGEPLTLGLFEVDADYFDVFALPFREGTPDRALSRPDAITLTESTARRLFGNRPALGRIVEVVDGNPLLVTAVVADLPPATSFPFEALVPIDEATAGESGSNWGAVNRNLFLKLAAEADPVQIERLMADVARPHIRTVFSGRPENAGDPMRFHLMPLADVHLKSIVLGTGLAANDVETVLAFAVIGLVILGMAVFNFTNIALARSLQRAPEVALRKVVGAGRRQILVQFLAESVLVTLVALLLGIMLAELLHPFLMDLLGRDLPLDLLGEPSMLFAALGLSLAAGVAGGLYPAVVASGYPPARLLHGSSVPTATGRVRSVLVALQFGAAIALIASMTVIYQQILFARGAEVGFSYKNVLVAHGFTREDATRLVTLEARLRQAPGVVETALASLAPGDQSIATFTLQPAGGGERVGIERYSAGLSYFDVLEIAPLYGRTFHRDHPTDLLRGPEGERHSGIVLNETAARRLGFATPADAVGASLGGDTFEIVGVIPDIHLRSVREEVQPTAFIAEDNEGLENWISLRLLLRFDPAMREAAEAAVERETAAIFGDDSGRIRVRPLGQQIVAQYDEERRRAAALATASVLAMTIAALGLYGLAAIAAERRTREIGIRKLFGARLPQLVRLLVWQFSPPVLLANLLAWPVAFLVMDHWLKGFAYRIELTVWPFLLAGAAVLLVGWATVGGHALRVAQTRPALALREE